MLRPVDEAPVRGSIGKKHERGKKAERTGALRVLDRTLLLAEIGSALVVTWLVAQYIYTAYLDTAPRHLTASRQPTPAALSVQGQAKPEPERTPTSFVPGAQATAEKGPDIAGVGTDVLDATWTARGQAAIASRTTTPTPTAVPTVDRALLLPSRLRIPVMFLDSPVHEVKVNMGVWQVSPMDIGHHEGTANPGETGNVVLAGHRDINSALFRELDRLKPGDEVFVSNSLGEYRYVVNDSFVVGPSHTEVMDPTTDKRVTLITCTPIGLATQRLIVTATLDETWKGEK